MSREHGYPPPPFERDRMRWAAFCAGVVERIQAIRAEDDAEWCAFGRPLPEQIEALKLPIGPVLPGPPPLVRLAPSSS